MPKYLRLAAVEGRRIVHPGSFTTPQMHVIAHERYLEGETDNFNPDVALARIPQNRYRAHGETELVEESHAMFLRRCIADGDLAYIEHVETFADKPERTWIDPDLKALTDAAKPKIVQKPAPAPVASEAAVEEHEAQHAALPAHAADTAPAPVAS